MSFFDTNESATRSALLLLIGNKFSSEPIQRKFKEYRYLYVHVRDIHSQEDYLKIRQTKLKGLNWFCDRCECYFASEANHKAIECRKYREMAGFDEPDDLQWPKERLLPLFMT